MAARRAPRGRRPEWIFLTVRARAAQAEEKPRARRGQCRAALVCEIEYPNVVETMTRRVGYGSDSDVRRGCLPRPELGVERKQSGEKQTSLASAKRSAIFPLGSDGDRWDPVAFSTIEAAFRRLAVEIGDRP